MDIEIASAIEASREFLLRHVRGLAVADFDVRPSGFTRSISEVAEHLLADDAVCIERLGGTAPDLEEGLGWEERLAKSGNALVQELRSNWAGRELEAFSLLSGGGKGIAQGVTYIQIENAYHAGQIAWIRFELYPDWDYDAAVYAPYP